MADTTAPEITLQGPSTLIIAQGATYSDPGATVSDQCDAGVSVQSDFDTVLQNAGEGAYLVTYTAQDAEGNIATATRTVLVEADCLPTLTLTRPRGDIVVPETQTQTTVNLAAQVAQPEGECDPLEVTLEYDLNGVLAGDSQDAENEYPVWVDLDAPGLYELDAFAIDGDTGLEVTESRTFEVRQAPDDDTNGLPDLPFDALLESGDLWQFFDAARGLAVRALRFSAGDANAPVLRVENPQLDTQYAELTVPLNLLEEGQSAILVLGLAAADSWAVLAPENVTALPDELAGGGVGLLADVLLETQDGAFLSVDPEDLSSSPLLLALNGLTFTEGLQQAFLGYEAASTDDPETGLAYTATGSEWSRTSSSMLTPSEDTLRATLYAPGFYAPAEGAFPLIQTVPTPEEGLSAGTTALGAPINFGLQVTNSGGAVLTGSAAVQGDGFTIAGNAEFSLEPGQAQMIALTFTPPDASVYEGVLVLSHNAGAPLQFALTGTGTKPLGTAVCGATNSSTTLSGDMLFLVFASILLLILLRRPRAKKED